MSGKKPSKWAEMEKVPGFIAPPGERKKPRAPKVTIKERDLQSMAENLCLALGVRFFRVPDKLLAYLKCYAPEWTRVFVSRYLSGLPDLLLFKSNPKGDNTVRFIEIKTEAGKLRQSQSKWHSGLNIHVTYGWAQTEKAILDFHRGDK
jgi:hypothetical protein